MLLSRDGSGFLGAAGLGASWLPAMQQPSAAKGYTRAEVDAMRRANILAFWERATARTNAFAAGVYSCPGSSASSKGCYQGQLTQPSPPGVFWFFDVPLHVAEIKNNRFDKSFRPSVDLRSVVEPQIVLRSTEVLTERLQKLSAARQLPAGIGRFSINQMINLVPELRTKLVNFTLNPITPTAAEYTQEYGWNRWIERGGYALMTSVINGKERFYTNASMPNICASAMCRCDAVPASANGKPTLNLSCVQAPITVDGKPAAFWIYLAIDQVPGGNWHLAYIYDTPGKLEKFANAIGGVLDVIAKATCIAAPAIKSQGQQLMAEKCLFPDGTPCTKGQSKTINGKQVACECVRPPDTSQAAVATSTFYAEKWCTGWAGEQAAPPTWEPPAPPMAPTPTSSVPWWLIAGGVATAAYLLLRK